ncbi:UNVERIFIED_CONTAM: hypothetical protein Sradi_3277700 [Sesamum radiatum]|uniref:Uncharacterized protein n=1 Tax=Sesamum radiatum TaxID=300843 RepID=A0AAW2R0C8_SESRA
MTNILFNLFINQKSAKEIWNTLETRYGGDDAGMKKYVVGKWLQFHMIDDKPIMDQVHEYENLVVDVLSEGMKMCDTLQANILLEKFSLFWSEYRNHLKHKKKDLNLQELINHMRTVEANQLKDKETSNPSSISSKANLVESSVLNKERFQNKGRNSKKEGNKNPSKAMMERSKRTKSHVVARRATKHTNAINERANRKQTKSRTLKPCLNSTLMKLKK